ncbi:BamA/TamA family outer membrane protein, partial [Stenotrophomonas maltophilia]
PSRAYKDGKIIPGPDERGRYTDPDQDPEAFGGNILITGGAELLFPLPFVKDQRQLRTVLFWDVGSTFDTDCPTNTTTNCDGIKT